MDFERVPLDQSFEQLKQSGYKKRNKRKVYTKVNKKFIRKNIKSQQPLEQIFQDGLQELKQSLSQRLFQQSSQQTRQQTIKQGEYPIRQEINRIQYQDALRFTNKWISKKGISWKELH